MSDEKNPTPKIRYFAEIALLEYSHERGEPVNRLFAGFLTGRTPLLLSSGLICGYLQIFAIHTNYSTELNKGYLQVYDNLRLQR